MRAMQTGKEEHDDGTRAKKKRGPPLSNAPELRDPRAHVSRNAARGAVDSAS